ncbi:MAG: peptide deformylase [Verrucomicrobiae bacterium]|nr:peptide deformylase [Verrucomicrobiae bacterium]
MILPIVQYGDPILRKKGEPIHSITAEIITLAEDMMDTMRDAMGIGLAAQQVGQALQLCVLDVPYLENRPSRLWVKEKEVALEDWMPMVLVNPKIQIVKKRYVDVEGCLSFPDITADISRSVQVEVEAQDLEGNVVQWKGEGLIARAIQHEFDHLQGILFIDRMDSATRSSLQKSLRALLK